MPCKNMREKKSNELSYTLTVERISFWGASDWGGKGFAKKLRKDHRPPQHSLKRKEFPAKAN